MSSYLTDAWPFSIPVSGGYQEPRDGPLYDSPPLQCARTAQIQLKHGRAIIIGSPDAVTDLISELHSNIISAFAIHDQHDLHMKATSVIWMCLLI